MHCNLRPPEPRQSFSALITAPCQVWSRWTYPLPYYSVFAADTLLYAVTLTFDPVTLTLNICSVSPVMWWNSVPNLNGIKQSTVSYSDFNIWPNNLNATWHVVLSFGIIKSPSLTFDNLSVPDPYSCIFDANTLCHAVTLTSDPLIVKVDGTSSIMWSKSVRNWAIPGWIIDNFANFCTRHVYRETFDL